MGDCDGSKKIASTTEMQNISLGTNRFSRDLLQRFRGSNSGYDAVKQEGVDGDEEEIELNLGLSLGGRFGVDKSSNKLGRSSSIASCLPVVRDDNDAVAPPSVSYSGLMRTSSLPVESEEEWRKRKELQTLRRMAAKRRRSEKQRNLKGDKEGGGSGNVGGRLSLEDRKEIEVNLRRRSVKRLVSSVESQFGLSVPPLSKGKGNYVENSGGMPGFGQSALQGSMEAKGVSSSNVSNLESKALQGPTGEPIVQSIQEETNQEVGPSGTRTTGNTSTSLRTEMKSPSKMPDTSRTQEKKVGTNSIDGMPSVFTKGDGPNGRRVDGILYKYGKGEEVRIMCVCHGSFHSPSEFVRHAGGSDVDHPLKHIVINPSSSSLF